MITIVTWTDWLVTPNARAFAGTRAEAEAYAEELPSDVTVRIVDSDDAATVEAIRHRYSGAQLVEIFNAFRDPILPAIVRFSDRDVGARRIVDRVAEIARRSPPIARVKEVKLEELKMSDEETKRGRGAKRYDSSRKITLLVTENPKKPGKKNYDRFAALMALPQPATVEQAIAAGVTLGDLAYDEEHNFLRVEPAEDAQQRAA